MSLNQSTSRRNLALFTSSSLVALHGELAIEAGSEWVGGCEISRVPGRVRAGPSSLSLTFEAIFFWPVPTLLTSEAFNQFLPLFLFFFLKPVPTTPPIHTVAAPPDASLLFLLFPYPVPTPLPIHAVAAPPDSSLSPAALCAGSSHGCQQHAARFRV
jgi:hypothetical protein